MSASRIEELLERLVEQNDEMLGVLHAIASNLDNVETSLESFREEVNEKLETLDSTETAADLIQDAATDKLDSIRHALTDDVGDNLRDIKYVLESELVWNKPVSSAAMILKRLEAIDGKLDGLGSVGDKLEALEDKLATPRRR